MRSLVPVLVARRASLARNWPSVLRRGPRRVHLTFGKLICAPRAHISRYNLSGGEIGLARRRMTSSNCLVCRTKRRSQTAICPVQLTQARLATEFSLSLSACQKQ